MTLPNFLVIGAHRSGTTSLYSYFRQHPQIYMPAWIKEARFFCYDPDDPVHRAKSRAIFPVRTLEEYTALFDEVRGQVAIGEASPEYLRNSIAGARIHQLIPHARLIASLRNPVDRAYSEYMMKVRSGNELRSFEQVCREEREWLERNLYFNNLQRYTALFSRDQLKVILFEEMRDTPLAVVQDCFRFLGVDDRFVPDVERRHNTGGLPKNRMVYRLFSNSTLRRAARKWLPERVRTVVSRVKERGMVSLPLAEETRQRLMKYFADDIGRLEELLGMDLSIWRNDAKGAREDRQHGDGV